MTSEPQEDTTVEDYMAVFELFANRVAEAATQTFGPGGSNFIVAAQFGELGQRQDLPETMVTSTLTDPATLQAVLMRITVDIGDYVEDKPEPALADEDVADYVATRDEDTEEE